MLWELGEDYGTRRPSRRLPPVAVSKLTRRVSQVLFKRKPVQFLPPAEVRDDNAEVGVVLMFRHDTHVPATAANFCPPGLAYSTDRRGLCVL